MSIQDEIEEGVDALLSQRDALRRRLGQYQALVVDLITAVALGDEEGVKGSIFDANEMVRQDVDPPAPPVKPAWPVLDAAEVNQANERLRTENAWLDERRAALEGENSDLCSKVADMDGQRARAERRAMELQAANDALRAEAEHLRAELRQAEAEPVEIEIPVRELAVAMTTLTTPEPDQNHTPPAAQKPARQPRLSEEQRQAASERMKAMRAKQEAQKAAERGLSAAQIAVKRAIKDRVWRAVPGELDKEFLRHTMALHGVTLPELVAAVRTFTPGDMDRTLDAADFYRACCEDAEKSTAQALAEMPEPTDEELAEAEEMVA